MWPERHTSWTSITRSALLCLQVRALLQQYSRELAEQNRRDARLFGHMFKGGELYTEEELAAMREKALREEQQEKDGWGSAEGEEGAEQSDGEKQFGRKVNTAAGAEGQRACLSFTCSPLLRACMTMHLCSVSARLPRSHPPTHPPAPDTAALLHLRLQQAACLHLYLHACISMLASVSAMQVQRRGVDPMHQQAASVVGDMQSSLRKASRGKLPQGVPGSGRLHPLEAPARLEGVFSFPRLPWWAWALIIAHMLYRIFKIWTAPGLKARRGHQGGDWHGGEAGEL
jgi:hypothetical protein